MKSINTRTPYVLVGSDFSQQEPRLLSFYSRDTNMINAYKQGKDLYATIAKGVYKMDYWDCMEHHEDGSPNPEGKKRRASCKAILLGIMYGRGAAAIAEQIHSTKEEAQKIVDDFYTSFPQVKTWMDESLASLKTKGYTEDFYGRRRRLTDINLPAYEVRSAKATTGADTFNPFIGCVDRGYTDPKVAQWEQAVAETVKKYNISQQERAKKAGKTWETSDEMSNAKYEALATKAKEDGILIFANTGRRAQAERQCVNARIQGGASTMTKIAMNKITVDPELASYDFHLCIGVHDELIGQCKAEYADACAARLCEIMKTAVADIVDVPFKCDPAVTEAWYFDEVAYSLQDKFAEMTSAGETEEAAVETIIKKYPEFTFDQIQAMLKFK